jgi:glucan phosphoethanolaminetransferase (alkaline phosphatase superfamily)
LLVAPGLWILVTDVVRRPGHLATFDALHAEAYAGTVMASTVFWAALLYNAARLRGAMRQIAAGLFVTGFVLSVGIQAAFHDRFNIYLSHDAQIYAQSLPQSLVGYLPLSAGSAAQVLVALAVALGLVIAARLWVRPRPWPRKLAPLLIPAVLYGMAQIPASFRMWQSTTPDIIYFHGVMSEIKERRGETEHAPDLRVQRRRPLEVPPLEPKPPHPRNVLFIIQESLRYDVCCNRYVPDVWGTDRPKCATPFSNDAAPNRYAFEQMRANASTTAISINNLWSGIPSHLGYDTLLEAPVLWDFAEAAGYHSSYWTSQNVMFGSMRLYVQDFPTDLYAYATNLNSRAAFDEGAKDARLTDHAIAEWSKLAEPFLAVVHYSNVHFPYVYDEDHAPFQPSVFSKEASDNAAYLNYYRNVAYLSDMAVGRLIDHVRQTESGKRTVIVYTSDHGEAFREHWQLGHTSSLYDEEIKVPSWIDAPEGTLSEAEERALRGAEQQLVWHYDLPATILDLMGVWDDPALDAFKAKMVGNPITRPERTSGPVPLQNCSWLWECGFRNWGMMQGRLKLEAREWDDAFHCFDVIADPEEREDLGERTCAPLADVARATFGPMPFQEWPDGHMLLFGPEPPGQGVDHPDP